MSEAYTPTNITDLPEDILYLVIQYLPLPDFLAFCASSKTFQLNNDLRFSASYWSRIARSTFRLPQHPVAANDGRRWMSLYRRMRTQTKVYTWGHNDGGCLGGDIDSQALAPPRPRPTMVGNRLGGMRTAKRPRRRPWPGQMDTAEWGIISDLQCGGWSTTALNSKGALFTVGVIDGLQRMGKSSGSHRLRYPPGFTPPAERYDPATAIQHFSAGRCHILGLSDNGRIWSWADANRPSVHIKFLTIDLVESEAEDNFNREGRVTKVVAGWDRSSAYIIGKGIVIWAPSNDAEIQGQSDESSIDGMLVLESWTVPLSSFRDPIGSRKNVPSPNASLDDSESNVGQVVSWIVLTQYVLFNTTTGKLFMSQGKDYETTAPSTICLNADRDFSDPSNSGEFILDVQGAHQSFAVFKRDGTVLTSTEEQLHGIWNSHHIPRVPRPLEPFSKIPCLQNTGVISLAFGDHHYHALHSDGTITSYGRELRQCGALGLGVDRYGELRGAGLERGLDLLPIADFVLQPECCTTGRRVFFEEEKKEWLMWMQKKMAQEKEERAAAVRDQGVEASNDDELNGLGLNGFVEKPGTRAQLSEWFEDKLRRWESDGPGIQLRENETAPENERPSKQNGTAAAADDDDKLPAYFALSIAAAGWHSGALVLVNEAKAKRATARCSRSSSTDGSTRWIWEERGDRFPKLRLKNGKILNQGAGTESNDGDVVELPEWLRSGSLKPIEQVEL